jgi:hypothetical protein
MKGLEMRFNFGTDPVLQTLPPRVDGWREAPAPSEKQVQNYGLLVSCLGILLVGALLHGEYVPRDVVPTLLILALTVPAHEFMHAISTPGWGLSNNTVIGVQTRQGLFLPYVFYDGEQPLWRFLLNGMAPTLLLTVLPILAIAFFPLSNTWRAGLGFLSFFNVGISGGDLVLFFWLSMRLPWRSSVRQKGWKLYLKTEI